MASVDFRPRDESPVRARLRQVVLGMAWLVLFLGVSALCVSRFSWWGAVAAYWLAPVFATAPVVLGAKMVDLGRRRLAQRRVQGGRTKAIGEALAAPSPGSRLASVQ